MLTEGPQSKLGRIILVDDLAQQIRRCMKIRVPNLLSGLQGKSQIVQDELVGLGEQIVQSAEGTRAVALELCHDLKISFYNTLQLGSGWKIVASFEGTFPNKIKQLTLDRHFDINNVKRVHCVLVNKVSASANATSGLGRHPLFKKEVVAIAGIIMFTKSCRQWS
ncbi:dynamin-2A-like isoform X2 [Pistacia vera]|uniref:dynamin-2A-like isoform X2 n=1 Tax=Pistacia vera TaxID=55513 RepID=UPI001262D527|nr:dynamin-2A-like isoform X2 [Pistacia vera]